MLAFDTERDGNIEVYVMRGDGNRQTRLTFNPAADYFAAWSPNGRKLCFTSERDVSDQAPDNLEIYTMRADGSRQVNHSQNSGADLDCDWQPRPDRHDDDADDD